MDTILVTGASGRLGKAVVETLVDSGINVRAATRHTTKIKWTDWVQPVVFDFEDRGLYRAALDGVSGVFLIAPPLDFQAPAKVIPFIDTAQEKGIRHVVFNSALKADSYEDNPLRLIERHLMKSGLNYAILRPNFFMENFSTGWAAPMIEKGEICMAAGDGKTSFISVIDIARVATVCFREKRSGAEYNLTGPEALSHEDVARIISDVCGRTITYKSISEMEMMKGAREEGMPESAIEYLAGIFGLVRKGLLAETTGIVREVTGKPPISFKEFVQKNVDICEVRKAA